MSIFDQAHRGLLLRPSCYLLLSKKFLLIDFVKFDGKKKATIRELRVLMDAKPLSSLPCWQLFSFIFIISFLLVNFVKIERKENDALRELRQKGEMMDVKPLSSLTSRRATKP